MNVARNGSGDSLRRDIEIADAKRGSADVADENAAGVGMGGDGGNKHASTKRFNGPRFDNRGYGHAAAFKKMGGMKLHGSRVG